MSRGVGDIGIGKGLQLGEGGDGRGLVALVVDLPLLQPHPRGEEAEPHRGTLMVAEEDAIVAGGVGECGAVSVVEVVGDAADAPGAERVSGGLSGEVDPQLSLPRHGEGVRLIVDVRGLEVVVPSVSEGGGDALPLALKSPDAEYVSLVEPPLIRVPEVKGVGRGDAESVVDAIEPYRLAHSYVVGYLGSDGVLVVDDAGHHGGAKEAVLLQHLLPHLGAEGRIDGGDEDRLTAKVFVDPSPQRVGGIGEVLVDPEGVIEGQPRS